MAEESVARERIELLMHYLDDGDCCRMFSPEKVRKMVKELRQLADTIGYQLPLRFQRRRS